MRLTAFQTWTSKSFTYLHKVLYLQGSTGSVSPPVSHASLEASDAALPTAEPPPIVEHAELQPALPASIHLADSRAAEAATILTIFGVTLSSVPILSPPLQHDSAHSAPSVSDEEPSEAEVTPPGSLVNEPGPARSSSLPLQSSLTVQPNPISTSMQQGSNPVTSPTQQPPSTTLKVCKVHHSGLPWHPPECCFQRQCTNI